jgi:hypothetical protein
MNTFQEGESNTGISSGTPNQEGFDPNIPDLPPAASTDDETTETTEETEGANYGTIAVVLGILLIGGMAYGSMK